MQNIPANAGYICVFGNRACLASYAQKSDYIYNRADTRLSLMHSKFFINITVNIQLYNDYA